MLCFSAYRLDPGEDARLPMSTAARMAAIAYFRRFAG